MKRSDRRSAARLAASQALYQMEIAGKGLNDILAEFETHLGVDQPFAEHCAVAEFLVGHRPQFVQHESQAVDEERIQKEHLVWCPMRAPASSEC